MLGDVVIAVLSNSHPNRQPLIYLTYRDRSRRDAGTTAADRHVDISAPERMPFGSAHRDSAQVRPAFSEYHPCCLEMQNVSP